MTDTDHTEEPSNDEGTETLEIPEANGYRPVDDEWPTKGETVTIRGSQDEAEVVLVDKPHRFPVYVRAASGSLVSHVRRSTLVEYSEEIQSGQL